MRHSSPAHRRLGPGFTVALVLAGLAIVTLRATATSSQASDDSYYFDSKPVPLTRSQTEVVVRFTGGVNAVNRPAQGTPGLQLVLETAAEGRNFSVLSIQAPAVIKGETEPGALRPAAAGMDQLLQTLRQDPGVEFVAPVFHYPATGVRVLPTDELIVRLKAGDSEADLASVAGRFGLMVDRPLDGTADQFVLRMIDGKGANAIDVSRALYETGRFQWAEPNFMQEYQKFDIPNDPVFSAQWHLKNTGQGGGTVGADSKLDQAWDIQAGSSSIVIAVVDDGMEKTHEDLSATVFVNPGETAANGIDDDGNGKIDDVSGWDFRNGDNNVTPSAAADNHGTSVSGVAAARGNNAIGVSGACRNCKVLPVKIFENGIATTSSNIANALTYAALFADVINNSWGGGAPSLAIQTAIANANTTGRGGKGAVVLFATGNSASGLGLYQISGFPSGTSSFKFEFLKNASVSSGSDTGWLAWVVFPGGALTTFNTAGLPAGWTTGGDSTWSPVLDPTHTDEGACLTRAAKPGAITHSQTTYLQIASQAHTAGSLFFYYWSSTEVNDGVRLVWDWSTNGAGVDYTSPTWGGAASVVSGVSYPAAHPESIAVGASSNYDCRSHYSQFGPEVAFVAPSSAGPLNLGIETTDRTGAAGYDAASNYTNAFGGTSSATPLASGIAGLILSRNSGLTRTEVLDILKNSANKVGPEPYVSGRNDRYGYGRLNAYQALLDTPAPAVPPGAFSHTSPANTSNGQPTNVTLIWGAATGTPTYEYCIDTINNSACDTGWTSTGASTSVGLVGLSPGLIYYWHVRATNGGGTTYAEANAASFWNFGTQPRPKAKLDLNGDGSGDAFLYNTSTGAWQRQLTQGGGTFATSNGNWSPGWTVVPATFDTDASSDLFLFSTTNGQWYKMLGSGGGFATQANGTWWSGWQRYVMDLDGDGISDVFLYDPPTGAWYKCISTPTGFNYTAGYWTPSWEIYPMNLNADGMGDMFLFNRSTGRWYLVLGAAGSGFTYPATDVWFTGWNFYRGDFNGDKLTDLLLHHPATGAYYVAMNNGLGTGFTYTTSYWALGWTPYVGDLDADGDDDLFLHNASNGAWYELVSNGTGGFTDGGGASSALGWNVYLTDLNGDGRIDVLLYNPSTGVWYQARNLSIGTFTYTTGTWPTNFVVIVRNPTP